MSAHPHDELVQQHRGMIARGVISNLDDTGDVQTADLHTGDDVGRSAVEVHQPYAFASRPPDAQPYTLVVSIGGDQGHQMAMQPWSAYRFGNLLPGEAAFWHWGGSRLHLRDGGAIDLLSAGLLHLAGSKVVVDAAGGLIFNGPVTFSGPVTFESDVTIAGNLTVGGTVSGTGATRGAL